MNYTPEQELQEIKRLIEEAENLAAKISRLIPKDSEWMHWRLLQHERSIRDVHASMSRLVHEAQEALLREGTVLWVWRNDVLVDYDYRGVDERMFPHVPAEFAGKKLWDVLSEEEALRWRRAWTESATTGTARVIVEAKSLDCVSMRYTARVNFKPGNERHVYCRPAKVAALKIRKASR